MILDKCKAQEKELLKKDDESRELQRRLQDYDSHMKQAESHYEQRFTELLMQRDSLAQERDDLLTTVKQRNEEILSLKKAHTLELQNAKDEADKMVEAEREGWELRYKKLE
jgi:hypothetical protein